MKESDYERMLVQGVKHLGGRAYKWVSPGNNGVPDRIVILPGGRVVFVEMKTEKGRLSEQQKVQIKRLSELGCEVHTLYGAGDVDTFLEVWEEQLTTNVDDLVRRGYRMLDERR